MSTQTPEAGVPWSIFQQGGGSGAALTWAEDALREIGAPLTQGNEQLIYDWEVSEGGGGWYNPLNQGPVPGQPQLTSTGPQYGGGAANYVSYAAGLTGTKDYLAMPSFSDIEKDLQGNNPQQARTDIINSDWAGSHYDWGSAFSDAPIPGKASVLQGGTVTDSATTATSGVSGFVSFFTSSDTYERAGLVILGAIIFLIGIIALVVKGQRSASNRPSNYDYRNSGSVYRPGRETA